MLTKGTATTTAPAQDLDLGPGSSRHASIRREMRRRAVVELVIGTSSSITAWTATLSKGHVGDHVNSVLAAAGYNFDLLVR